ncbi:sugar transferase [Pseudonocardia bannensis]|uniref:Sugar transferase n=2 Tax=Pseudonocardia bannensis TaxID=630973 RepID=A0A848DHE3_9PSEU|nr:sugar transferase [Pseudonocardia bannensis]
MLVLPVDGALLLAPLLWDTGQAKAVVAMAVVSLLLLFGGGRYRARLHLSVLDELPRLLGKLLTAAALVATVTALRHDLQDAVAGFLVNAALAIGLVLAGRVLTTRLIGWGRRRRITAHRTVLIGGGALAAELAQILGRHPRYGLAVAGFVDDGSDCIAAAVVPQLGGLSDLDAVVRRTGADVLLVADGDFSERALLDVVRTPACRPCDLLVVPRLHYFHTQTGMADHIGSIPVMRIRTPSLRGPARLVKRGFDIAVAGVALLVAAPLLAVCALAVRLEGGPGVIFRQARVGRDGQLFDCLKLRSMRPANEAESATNWSVANDNRVGPVGKFLRRSSLDELPQLWNILRGDMTLVGPRPERPHFVDLFSAEYDRYAHRHRVQAGLTGLAQVSGLRGDTSIADRARFDNYYIENWSLWLDIKIVIRTFAEVFCARGR